MTHDRTGAEIPARDMPHEIAPDIVDTMTPDELQAWLDRTYGPVKMRHAGSHRWVSCDDNCSACLVCGAHYDDTRLDAGDYMMSCTSRTDMVHGSDDISRSHHSLDGCDDFDERGACEHTNHDCDCDSCR